MKPIKNAPKIENTIVATCKNLERPTDYQIMEEFNLLEGHPWAETARSPKTNYYTCLYGIAVAEKPRKILEIGTAFGMSGSTLIKSMLEVELFISLDLGIYGQILGMTGSNIDFTRQHIHAWCREHQVPVSRVRFFRANTQPLGKGDNENLGSDIPHWQQIQEVVQLVQGNQFDIIFTDGKHTEDGLLNDLSTFWPYLKPGGLMICDDLHDPQEYTGIFPWAGDTWQSYHTFVQEKREEIAEHVIWNYPQVQPGGKLGLRPFGLIRKAMSALANETGKVSGSQKAVELFSRYCEMDAATGKFVLPAGVKRVWLDIGAHECETTLPAVLASDDLAVLAFEPLQERWKKTYQKHPRLLVFPFAVSSTTGVAKFYQTREDAASSLLPFNQAGLDGWLEKDGLAIVGVSEVETVRLEQVLEHLPIDEVEYVKIDTQGHDLEVIKSAGLQLERIAKLKMEVTITPSQLYMGAASKAEAITYLEERDYKLTNVEIQSKGQEENLTFVQRSKLEHDEDYWNNLRPEDLRLVYQIDVNSYNVGLQPHFYGQVSGREVIWRNGALVFNPTSEKDHLTTPFIPMGVANQVALTGALVEFHFPEGFPDLPFPILLVQDQDFHTLATPVVRSGETGLKARIHLSLSIKQVRITMMGNNGQPCCLPTDIRVWIVR